MFFLEFSTSGEEQKKYFFISFQCPTFCNATKENASTYIISILKVELFTFGEVRKLIYNASNPSWGKTLE